MNSVKYINLNKAKVTLLETLVGTRYKSKNKFKKAFFESIEKGFILTEGIKENLSKLVDDVMFFFKNTAENNKRLDYLINVGKKALSLHGFTNAPALNRTLHAFIGKEPTGDRLKQFLKLWMNYLVYSYDGKSPIITFNMELGALESALKAFKNNGALQGYNNNIDELLSENGLISILKKLSNRLNDGAEELKNNAEYRTNNKVEAKPNISDKISIKKQGENKLIKLDNNEDLTNLFTSYQEREQFPKDKRFKTYAYESVYNAFIIALDTLIG